MRNHSSLMWLVLILDGVFAETAAVKPVSVIEGDSVTLYTNVTEVQRGDKIEWTFGADIIAKIEGGKTFFSSDGRFIDRLELDSNGSLTIKNIKKEHEGVYKLDIGSKDETFRVTVRESMMNVSVMEGESVTLRTGVIEIQAHDLILWKFEDHLIAEINKETNRFLTHDSSDKIFKGRLQPNEKTGSLTISKSRTTDSGVYHLHMSNSSYTVQRNIGVTVSDAGLSSAAVAGICVAVFLPLIVALTAVVMYYRHRISEIERQINPCEEGTSQRIL